MSFIINVKQDSLDVLICAFYRCGSFFISVLLNSPAVVLGVIWLLWIVFWKYIICCARFYVEIFVHLWNHVLCKEYQFDSFNSNLSVLYFCVLLDYLDKNIRILRSMKMKTDSLALFHRYFSIFSKMLMFVDLWPHLWWGIKYLSLYFYVYVTFEYSSFSDSQNWFYLLRLIYWSIALVSFLEL